MVKKLSVLQVGEYGIISSIADNEFQLKLMEMGCIPGEAITLTQIAPFGDPIAVRVAGYSLSLRLSEADSILVELNKS